MKLRLIAALAAALLAARYAHAQTAPQTTDGAASTAKGATWVPAGQKIAPRAMPRDASGNPIATINSVFVAMPDVAMPGFDTAFQKAIADMRAGTIMSHTNPPASADDYMVIRTITWYNLVQETTNGMELYKLSDVKSVSGNNDIGMSQYVESFTSSDGGSLNGSLTFDHAAYTPNAPLYVSDGTGGTTVVTGGDATQLGKEFILGTHAKQYIGGNQSNLNADKTWVSNHTPFTMTFVDQIGNVSSTTQIGTALIFNDVGFNLGITKNASNATLWVNGADSLATYQVVGSGNLMSPLSSWTNVTTISGTNTVIVPVSSSNNGFFSVKR